MTGTVQGEAQGYCGGRRTVGWLHWLPCLWAPLGFPQELAKRAQPGDCRCHCQEENILDFRGPPTCLPPLLTGAPGRNLASPRILLFPDRTPRDPGLVPQARKAGGLSSLLPHGLSLLPLAWATLRRPEALPSPPRPASSKPLSTQLPERQQIPLIPPSQALA